MTNAWVIEFKADKTFLSQVINAITQSGYTHTGMILKKYNHYYFCDLAGFRKKAYQYIDIGHIDNYLKVKTDAEAYKINVEFNQYAIDSMLAWWEKSWSYGYLKLVSFLIYNPLLNFARWYHRKTGRIFRPVLGNIAKREILCAGAVDKCFTEIGHFDSFPVLDEDMIIPGAWANDQSFERYTPDGN